MRKLSAAIAAAVALAASCVSAQAQPPTAPAAPGADQLACTTEFLKRWQVVANHVENLARRSRDSERGWLCSYTRAIVGWKEDLINFAQSDEASMRAWRMVRRTNDGPALPDACLVVVDMSVPVARREGANGMSVFGILTRLASTNAVHLPSGSLCRSSANPIRNSARRAVSRLSQFAIIGLAIVPWKKS